MKRTLYFLVLAAISALTLHADARGGSQSIRAKGTVQEVLEAGGYTYLRLKPKKGPEVWAAIMKTPIKKGAWVELEPGFEMKNFGSKMLKRTFKSVIFTSGIVGAAKKIKTEKPAETKNLKDEAVKVKKASGENAYTISEIYGKRAALHEKEILVRGKVVKFSEEIMGRNWVHLQDGTGTRKAGTHDLLVTTQESPQVGDVVTFSGTVLKDQDFGSGYAYKVLVGKAKLISK